MWPPTGASPRRRCVGRGAPTQSYEEILAAIQRRDAIDSGRAAAPLKPAPDAVIVDSTRLSVTDVIEALQRLIDGSDA